MEDQNNLNLAQRVERLEAVVEKLAVRVERVLGESSVGPSSPAASIPPPPPPVTEKPRTIPRPTMPVTPAMSSVSQAQGPSSRSFTLPEHMRKSEYWLNKIGIGLLLFGAVFLFKYSVDQGWLTPAIRVVFGLALGLLLSVFGIRLYSKKKHFSQVLLGGSIATFYITGFSAFQLFHLVTYPAAFTFFIAVTCYSFYLSIKQNEFIFSLIAIIGGLGTPFLLFTGEGSIPGLMLYLCILLGGSSGIYFFKGWWSFFWTSCIGGITVIWMAMFEGKSLTYAPMLDKVSIEIALFLMLPFFWLTPLVREVVALKDPKMVNAKPSKSQETTQGEYKPNLAEINVNLLTVVIPFLGLFLSTAVWQWSDKIFGMIGIALALVFGYVGWALNLKTELKNFAYTHIVVALALVAVSLQFFFEGDVLFAALSIQAIAIHLVRLKIGSRSLAPVGHVLFGLVGAVLLLRLAESREGLVLLNSRALTDLIVPAGAFGLIRLFQRMDEKRAYLIGGFLALAGIMLRELDGNVEFLVIIVEILALCYVAFRLKDNSVLIFSHVASAVIASWLAFRLTESQIGVPVFNFAAMVDLVAVGFAFIASFLLSNSDEKRIYFLSGFAFLAAIFIKELSGNLEFLVISAEALVLLFIASRKKDHSILIASHFFNAVVGLWLISRLFESSSGTSIFNLTALLDMAVFSAAAAATYLLSNAKEKSYYLLFAHVALLLWFLRELSPLENGQGLVSAAWGVYTIGLFVAGLRMDMKSITKVAMITLLVLVGKLFLIDLANIETIWRIVIFLGFGAVLLFLSYYFQSLWRTKKG